ncbi:hypothetical protein NPIL_376221 [Nephila pilipes]|uniref:Uncharacterized protein n=1 Tax=Nephila pilipes TaxID=299642 RepID=A0A8X6Q6B0_NEPPI|nr:hypothetical protein NPIL_376221 [Nephila pilipes]
MILINLVNSETDYGNSESWPEEQDKSADQDEDGGQGEYDEPKPQTYINLLIEDIDRQETRSVYKFYGSSRPECVEIAFSKSWKYTNHWIITQ